MDKKFVKNLEKIRDLIEIEQIKSFNEQKIYKHAQLTMILSCIDHLLSFEKRT